MEGGYRIYAGYEKKLKPKQAQLEALEAALKDHEYYVTTLPTILDNLGHNITLCLTLQQRSV